MTLELLKGKLTKGGSDYELAGQDFIGIYFSAHWCPPCRGFTPALADFYNKVQEKGQSFEIVFVSSDRDDASFNEYFASMPWAALKFAARDEKDKISGTYGVRGIPTLVILDKSGNLVTQNGRGIVGQRAEDPDATNWA